MPFSAADNYEFFPNVMFQLALFHHLSDFVEYFHRCHNITIISLQRNNFSMSGGNPPNFMNAVIDKKAFKTISEYIDFAREDPKQEILCGGTYDDREGYFIQPTVVQSQDPRSKLMCEEIFGPVLTVYVYPENEYDTMLQVCDTTSPYALTGAVFAQDRFAIVKAVKALRNSAGNFYINDTPTGAVVGQQPFGGARASGTNDKAGSWINLERWISPRAIKETFLPPTDYRYSFLSEE